MIFAPVTRSFDLCFLALFCILLELFCDFQLHLQLHCLLRTGFFLLKPYNFHLNRFKTVQTLQFPFEPFQNHTNATIFK